MEYCMDKMPPLMHSAEGGKQIRAYDLLRLSYA